MGITDPRGDIAGDPAAGYGRFRFHPNIIPRIIISASANSVRTAPPRRGARINISAACTRAAAASCRGRSLPLSTRCRLPLRRVVSESTALPHPARELADRRRMQAGRAASSPGRASSGGCGRVALTAGEVCRAAGCPTGKGILCDESQTFPLQVNGTEKSPGVSTPGQQVTEAREL